MAKVPVSINEVLSHTVAILLATIVLEVLRSSWPLVVAHWSELRQLLAG